MSDANLYKGINHHFIRVDRREPGNVAFTMLMSGVQPNYRKLFGWAVSWKFWVPFVIVTYLVFTSDSRRPWYENNNIFIYILALILLAVGWLLWTWTREIKSHRKQVEIVCQDGIISFLDLEYERGSFGGFKFNGEPMDTVNNQVFWIDVAIDGVTYGAGFFLRQNSSTTADTINQMNTLVAEGLQIAEPITGGGSLTADAANDGDWE